MTAVERSAAGGTLLLTAGHLWLTLTSYAIAIILARGLGPDGFGVYGLVYGLLITVELVGRLGLPLAIARRGAAAGAERAREEAAALTLALLISTGLLAGAWLAAPALAAVLALPANGAALLRLAALDIPFYGLFFVAIGALQGRSAFAAAAACIALYATARLVALLALLPFGLTVETALIANILGSAIGLAGAAVALGAVALRPTLVHGRSLLRLALPLSLRGLGVQLLAVSGLLALGLFPQRVSDAERGLFVAATSLARMPSVFVFGATGTLTPSIVRAGKAGAVGAAGRLLGDATGLVLLVLVPLTAFLTVEARAVLGLILTADFADAAPLLVVLALGLGLLFNLAQLQGAALVAVDRHGLAAVTALLAAALAFAGALLLVPPLGAIGAALAMAGASALLLASNALAAAGALGAWIAPRLLLGHATLGAAAALLAWLVPTRGAWLILEAALLGGCYLAAAAALGLIPASARAALRARWSAP